MKQIKYIVVKQTAGKEDRFFTIHSTNRWATDITKAYLFPNEDSAKTEADKYKNIIIMINQKG